jgi:hypothetical protein
MVRRRSPDSSPGEGLNTCKTPFFITIESLPSQEGVAGRVGDSLENSPQIVVFSPPAEHLREAEGLDEIAAIGILKTPWKRAKSESRARARRTLGTGFGEH